MPAAPLFERNLLVPMRDGVELAVDVLRPADGGRVPALLNFGPYHKDGRGGRLAVEAVHRHFVARGYAGVSADLRGLGSSGGISPGAFAAGEGLDGHDLVEWIAAQPWCDGRVGMWGVSYPGVTSLATAATRPPHLQAIVPIHASSDLWRGVAGLGGTRPGFWMRADWGPRMAAYNLMPPQWRDRGGRWERIWSEHLQHAQPWLEAFTAHPGFDDFWKERVIPVDRITCPAMLIGGWRDLYADCTPRDFALLGGPRRLLMGPWKHEFPDNAREAPTAGLREMERWFDRWLRDAEPAVEHEPPVHVYLQGQSARWQAEAEWPPRRQLPQRWKLHPDGSLVDREVPAGECLHRHDPTIGMASLVWDPWTTALDPALPRDQSSDDARSLCWTSAPLTAVMELQGMPLADLDVQASALPLQVVVKLSAVAANGVSTLITTGWSRLDAAAQAPGRVALRITLRASAWRLEPGERLRLAISCADFPRIWPTPVDATLSVLLGSSAIELPVCPTQEPGLPAPQWGPLQPGATASTNDLGGTQGWELTRDLMHDGVRLAATRSERIRIDGSTQLTIDHAYGASVAAARPDQARMSSTTTVRLTDAVGHTDLVCRTLSTAGSSTVDVNIQVDGQPHWQQSWRFGPDADG